MTAPAGPAVAEAQVQEAVRTEGELAAVVVGVGLINGEEDLLALHVESARLDAEIRWEPGVDDDPESMLFPHLYGPLPLSAVVDVTPYPRSEDGTFAPFDGRSA